MKKKLTHLDNKNKAKMVDVAEKVATVREARAKASIVMNQETFQLIKKGEMAKGDVLSVSKIAGIMAAKRASELIPLCHPLMLSHIDINFELKDKKGEIIIESKVRTTEKTGVEMEALTAVAISALTIYDMCKAIDRGMMITGIYLLEKSGGRSGHYIRGKG